jgi:hypothetical protein
MQAQHFSANPYELEQRAAAAEQLIEFIAAAYGGGIARHAYHAYAGYAQTKWQEWRKEAVQGEGRSCVQAK